MGLLDRIAMRLGYSKAQPAPAPLLAATGAGQAYSLPDLSVPDAQAELFQRLSWVHAAVMSVATVGASASLNVLQVVGEKRKDIPNHELEMLLLRPNPLDSRTELMIKTFAYYALTGNAYWWLNKLSEAEPPREIWCLPPHQIEPVPDGRMFLKGYRYVPGLGEQDMFLQPWEVVHFKRFHPRNWFVGLSPIEALAVVATGDLKAQEYNTAFFGKNNAKVPGALAFADDVNDVAWAKLQREIKEGWGGTNRGGMMLLRGAGQGGVQWVQMALSQADMQFLEARTFTKEEIFSIFAPGLASVLDVNATEANAKSGKATFIDMAVWPVLVAVAEKITNNLLPVYGGDLVAEFDDIRIVDRALQIQEQATYSLVHTVNEIRTKFYDDKPLDDVRGDLFPAQIGASAGVTDDTEPASAGEQPLPPLEELPQEQPATDAALPENAPPDVVDDGEAMQAEAKARKELAAWRRYAVKHGAEKARTWKREHVQADVADVIVQRLAAATTVEEVKAAFVGPFLKAGSSSEARVRQRLKRMFGDHLDEALRLLGDPPDLSKLATWWPQHESALAGLLQPELERVAEEGVAQVIAGGAGVDWVAAAVEAAEWASTYTFDLVRGLTDTTRKILQDTVAAFMRTPGQTIGTLRDALAPFFGPSRADAIAVTEVTRAFYQGQQIAVRLAAEAGQHLEGIWDTNNDELVCDVCGPLHGKREEVWREVVPGGPPAHPRCRCAVHYRLERRR